MGLLKWTERAEHMHCDQQFCFTVLIISPNNSAAADGDKRYHLHTSYPTCIRNVKIPGKCFSVTVRRCSHVSLGSVNFSSLWNIWQLLLAVPGKLLIQGATWVLMHWIGSQKSASRLETVCIYSKNVDVCWHWSLQTSYSLPWVCANMYLFTHQKTNTQTIKLYKLSKPAVRKAPQTRQPKRER